MDSSVPMILPKGIVINTKNVYNQVASYDVLPADKIWEYWHVYTTTNKRLKDPTARRLENFWWQVWGSDRRYLSGRALAKLYEDISVGPTFVPLRGPANRWEGPDVPPLTRQLILAHLGLLPPPDATPSPSPSAGTNETSLRNLSSSASKPPPSHPILKKARGPSTSGSRPTARFISPHESADEDDRESGPPSSDSAESTGLELPLTTNSNSKKKAPMAAKKFAPPSSLTMLRPGLPRRTSPQSPLSIEFDPREESNASGGPRISGSQRPVSPILETPLNQENGNSIPSRLQGQPKLSAKAAGKRPALQRRITPETRAISRTETPSSALTERTLATGLKAAPSAYPASQTRRASDNPGHSRTASDVSNSTRSDVGSSGTGPEGYAAPKMGRSQSHTGEHRNGNLGRAPKHGLFTGATASTTTVAAQGTIVDQSGFGSIPSPHTLDSRFQHELSLPDRTPVSSLLDSRFTPTQPNTSASVPMGRTKSQLTLLLERENARIGDKRRPRH